MCSSYASQYCCAMNSGLEYIPAPCVVSAWYLNADYW